jgi:hypothetical protein
MKLKIPLLTLLLLISLTGIAGWLGESSIKGAFGITLGEVTKSNKKRSESFTPKGDVSVFDNFYYIFANDSRRIYDISAFTHSCDGFEKELQTLESKYGAFSKYKQKGRSGKYYRYASGDREVTLRCDRYYGFPMAISYIDKEIKSSNAVIEKIVEDAKTNFYDGIEKIIKEDYINQVSKKIHSEWRLIKAKAGWTCEVKIIQDREGNILDSNISKCNTKDKRFIAQLQKAINKSSPLPRSPESLFSDTLILHPKVKYDIDLVKSIRKKYKEGDPKAVAMVRLLKSMLHRKNYNEDLIKELKQMHKNGNPVAIEVIKNMKKMINEVEN